jgi:hypothetical protein
LFTERFWNFIGQITTEDYTDSFPEQFVPFFFFNLNESFLNSPVYQSEPFIMERRCNLNIIDQRYMRFRDIYPELGSKIFRYRTVAIIVKPGIFIPSPFTIFSAEF